MTTDLNLSNIPTADSLLRRAGAGDLLGLLERLGFWVGGDNPTQGEGRETFPRDISRLNSDQLGDKNAYYQSELSRAIGIIGALQAQRLVASFDVKRVRNQQSATVIRTAKEAGEKLPTKEQLNVEVSERPEVVSAEEKLLLLDVVLGALGAVKDAYDGYCRVLSREVTRRGDLLKGRI